MEEDDDDVEEMTFDEAVRTDPRPAEVHVANALNSLHFALHKMTETALAVPIVNAIAELEEFLGDETND